MANVLNNVKANNGVVTPENCKALADILALNNSIIGNHQTESGTPDEEVESLNVQDIMLDEEDRTLFCKSRPSAGEYDYKQTTELQNEVLNVLKEVFGDIFAVNFSYDTNRGYVFTANFKYTPDELADDTLVKAVTSSINPEDAANKNSIAANILMLSHQQQMSSYDASKYAKLTKECKESLYNLLWFSQNNKKKKWIKGENYILSTTQNRSFNGMTFTNIVATVYLDAEKVIAMMSGDQTGKYQYNIIPISNNITGTDSLLKIEKVNISRKKQLSSKYGIQFTR